MSGNFTLSGEWVTLHLGALGYIKTCQGLPP